LVVFVGQIPSFRIPSPKHVFFCRPKTPVLRPELICKPYSVPTLRQFFVFASQRPSLCRGHRFSFPMESGPGSIITASEPHLQEPSPLEDPFPPDKVGSALRPPHPFPFSPSVCHFQSFPSISSPHRIVRPSPTPLSRGSRVQFSWNPPFPVK